MQRLLTVFLLIVSTSLFASSGNNIKTDIPPNGYTLIPIFKKQIDIIFPGIPEKAYPQALSEHETCIYLKHSRCLNPKSRLKTSREEGAGLGQITRAYRKDGTQRFDALADLRKRHIDYLSDLSWDNVYSRPDLQINAILVMLKDYYGHFIKVVDPMERLKMTDAAYNGGPSGVDKERIACGLAKNCDPQIWFDNVERYCLKSKEPLYGNRSACQINRHHVADTLDRIPKYQPYFK